MHKDRKDVILIILSILVALLDLLILYYVKYRNQHLPFLKNFDLFYIGNIITLLFFLVLILGLFVLLIKRGIAVKGKSIFNFTIVTSALLIVAAIISNVRIEPSYYYIFHEPAEKIIEGFFYLIFQLAEFAFIAFVWLTITRRKKHLLLESILDSMVLFFLVMVGVFLFELFVPIHKNVPINKESANLKSDNSVAVVLGAAVWPKNKPSPSLKGRLNKAFQLYELGVVNKIQLTGGNAPGELTEARVGYNYLIDKGILPRDLMLEERTSSTSEQISFIKANLMNNKNEYNIFVVSDAFHLPRVLEICKFFNIKVNVVPSDQNQFNNIDVNVREIVALTFFWLFSV